jgi:hypothetical protein
MQNPLNLSPSYWRKRQRKCGGFHESTCLDLESVDDAVRGLASEKSNSRLLQDSSGLNLRTQDSIAVGALTDQKLELFAQALLRNVAHGMARGKAATEAAREAGYRGSAMADNARKRANRKDVKARMIELAAPAQAQVEADIAIDLAAAERRLWEIIQTPISLDETVMPKNVIDAIKTLAAVRGWNAPTNINVNKHVHTDWSTEELVAFITDARASLERDGSPAQGLPKPDQVH